MRRKLLLVLLVCLASAALAHDGPRGSLEQAGGSSGGGVNALQDTDLDTFPDYILVGDYDGDGTREMSDIQAGYTALTDTGHRHLVISAGTYTANATANTVGLLEIEDDDNVTVECQGGAVLMGRGPNDPDVNIAIIHIGTNSTNVVVKNCEFNGGWPTTYNTATACPYDDADEPVCTNKERKGIHVDLSTNVRLYNNFFHDTVSTATFIEDGTDYRVEANKYLRVGAYGDTNGSPSFYPAIWMFQQTTYLTAARFYVLENDIEKTADGIVASRVTPMPLTNIVVRGNSIKTARDSCLRVSGASNSVFADNTCIQTRRGIDTGNAATTWWDGYTTGFSANKDVLFENNQILGTTNAYAGIWVQAWGSNITFKNNHVLGFHGDGYIVESPQRRLLIDGGRIAYGHNDYDAIREDGSLGGGFGASQEETVTYRNLVIGPADDAALEHPLLIGPMTEAQAVSSGLTTCNNDLIGYMVVTTDASGVDDCTFASGTGTADSRCLCYGSWTALVPPPAVAGDGHGMALVGGPGHTLENIAISGVSGNGISFSATNLSGAVLKNLTLNGTQWGYLGETASPPTCTTADHLNSEGKWFYDTGADNRRERCLNGAWGALADQTAIRHAISLPAITGTGPTIENVTCTDWGTDGNCIDIADGATATNGRIRNVVARHRHGDEADTDAPTVRTNWVIDITDELGTGWIAEGILGENVENAGLIDNGTATTGLVSEIVSSGAPPTELCDNTNEIGSVFRQTDGAAASTLEVCEGAGPAWAGK